MRRAKLRYANGRDAPKVTVLFELSFCELALTVTGHIERVLYYVTKKGTYTADGATGVVQIMGALGTPPDMTE